MWSLDWFSARELAKADRPIRRVAWAFGTWVRYFRSLWWIRVDGSWRVVRNTDIIGADLRARDWTTESYHADICGGFPAYNADAIQRKDWGDLIIFTPIPVPSYPDDIPAEIT